MAKPNPLSLRITNIIVKSTNYMCKVTTFIIKTTKSVEKKQAALTRGLLFQI